MTKFLVIHICILYATYAAATVSAMGKPHKRSSNQSFRMMQRLLPGTPVSQRADQAIARKKKLSAHHISTERRNLPAWHRPLIGGALLGAHGYFYHWYTGSLHLASSFQGCLHRGVPNPVEYGVWLKDDEIFVVPTHVERCNWKHKEVCSQKACVRWFADCHRESDLGEIVLQLEGGW